MITENTARFRFYEELNDFLPLDRRKTQFTCSFSGTPSVKDAIEAIGVPHTEIDLIVVNGQSAGFEFRLKNNDEVSVYPVFESLDISPIARLREAPLCGPRFICDVHLGALARLLRLAGFDTAYQNDYSDERIVSIALLEKRCVLTRDRGILKRKAVTHGYCVRSSNPEEQAREVLLRFDLWNAARPFSLCITCNGAIGGVNKQDILALLPEMTRKCYDEFYRCGSCGKVYWRGGHFENLRKLAGDLTAPPAAPADVTARRDL